MMDESVVSGSVADIATEMFRFQRVFVKAIKNADLEDQNKYISQFNWFKKKVYKALDELDLRIVDLEGQKYDPGMAVTPLNLDDFDDNEELIVIQMIEPIIMREGTLVKTGTVMLGRAE